jgi:predicted GIY-YIG superfamily endonuclease
MKFVYILESEDGAHFYVGVTEDVHGRVKSHNAGNVTYTSKFRPWRLRTFIAFDDEERAFAFERYLKSGSGRAFAKKRF